MSVVNVKGLKMYYEIIGSGPIRVVLVIGLATSCRLWEKQLRFFKRDKRFTVCIFDNRGSGLTGCTMPPYSTTQMARDALNLLSVIKWDRFHLVGLSMGCRIATELSLMIPKRILSLTLAVTHAGGLYAIPPLQGLFYCGVFALAPTNVIEAHAFAKLNFSQEFLQETFKFNDRQDLITISYMDTVVKQSRVSFTGLVGQSLAVVRHYVSHDRLVTLRDSGIPILLLTGTKDLLVNPKNTHYLSSVLKPKRFEVFKGAGHMIHIERSKEFNSAIHSHILEAEGIVPHAKL